LNIRCCGLATDPSKNLYGRSGGAWIYEPNETTLEEDVRTLIRCIEDERIKGGETVQVFKGKSEIMALKGPLPRGAGTAFCIGADLTQTNVWRKYA